MQVYRSAATMPAMPAAEGRQASDSTQAFLFGEYRLDLAREQLIGPRGGQVLRRKTFATLRLLLAASPAVVSRDQLLDGVWGRHAISTSAVPNVIVELRHALGDAAQAPRYIETRHRRGYRIIPVVRREVDSDLQGERGDAHPLLTLLEEVRGTSAHVSPRLQLELLHRAASDHGLTFLALQAQLALQVFGVELETPKEDLLEEVDVTSRS